MELRKEIFGDEINIRQHVCIPKSHHPVTLGSKRTITNFIAQTVLIFAMLAAVQFDNELRGVLYKIENLRAKRYLAAEVAAERLQCAEFVPELAFSIRRMRAEISCTPDCSGF